MFREFAQPHEILRQLYYVFREIAFDLLPIVVLYQEHGRSPDRDRDWHGGWKPVFQKKQRPDKQAGDDKRMRPKTGYAPIGPPRFFVSQCRHFGLNKSRIAPRINFTQVTHRTMPSATNINNESPSTPQTSQSGRF